MKSATEEYAEKRKSPQKEILRKLARIILKTLPNVKEDLYMGVPWFDRKYYLVAFKDHVNMGFSVRRLTNEEKSLFEGSGSWMRHVKFWSLEGIDEERIMKLLRLVADKSGTCEEEHTC